MPFSGHTHLPFGFPAASQAKYFCELDIRFYDTVHELFYKTTEPRNILMIFYRLTVCNSCNAFFGTGKMLAHKVISRMPKSFNNYVSNLPALNWLLYGKKQCTSLYEIRGEEAMKKALPKRYQRTDNSLTLHVICCCYQLHVLILKTCGLSCNCRVWI